MARLTDRLDMTIAVDWDVKPQNNNSNSIAGRYKVNIRLWKDLELF